MHLNVAAVSLKAVGCGCSYEEYSVKMRELDAVADAKIAAATKAINNNGSLRNISVNGSAHVF